MGGKGDIDSPWTPRQGVRSRWQQVLLLCGVVGALYSYTLLEHSGLHHRIRCSQGGTPSTSKAHQHALEASIDRCKAIHLPAGPPSNFHARTRSDRAIENAPPILIRNVTLWTGRPEEGDELGEVLEGVDISVADGLIRSIVKSGASRVTSETVFVDGRGRWLTPGIIDVHIHAGLDGLPALRGIDDTNSLKSQVSPYLRSIDGVSNHDWGFVSIASGGITTGLALPGSADNVGGQAFPVKLGRLGKKAVSEGGWTRIIDPPRSLILPGEGASGRDNLYAKETGMKREDGSSSFRYMKMACGENDRRVYKETRMDEAYNFRQLFDKAATLKRKQDDFCEQALSRSARFTSAEEAVFPDDLALEAVVDVLRGKTKVNTHCYTLEDFSSFVSHTNEFKFPLAAFHHAHEAYLVPDLLKRVYGGTPAVALFSLNANYKTEAYFGSPFAAAILSSHNITTLTKSDHPVTNSRRLLSQVAQAHHFGLSAGKALRGVTSCAARVLGLDHRIGQVKAGFDADLVLWDKNPLMIGAKPVEVIIDGVRQELHKNDDSMVESGLQKTAGRIKSAPPPPSSANYSQDIKRVMQSGPEIVAWETVAFPTAKRRVSHVLLHNVSQVYSIERGHENFYISSSCVGEGQSVYLADGKAICVGNPDTCPGMDANVEDECINLNGGVVIPGLIAFGSNLGIADIVAEPSTRDGDAIRSMPAFAADSLRLGGNDLRFAHAMGVRTVVSAPEADVGLEQGVATHFDAGVEDLFEKGAIRQAQVALHLSIDHWQASDRTQPTVGQQIGKIRDVIKRGEASERRKAAFGSSGSSDSSDEEMDDILRRVSNGSLPLIVQARQAETISQLIMIKEAYPRIHLILRSADEASFASLPSRLKTAGISVLIRPIEWPQVFDARRAVRLGGVQASGIEPLLATTKQKQRATSLLGALLAAGVQVGVAIDESWQASTLLWDTIAAGQEAGLSYKQSLELVTTSTANILKVDLGKDVVAFDGSPFEYGARPIAISTPRGVDLMDS